MKAHRNQRNRRGFTLAEVLVVVFILVTLASVSIVAVQGIRERAKVDQAGLLIKGFVTALQTYEAHVGRPPTTEQGLAALLNAPGDLANPDKWSGPYLTDSAKDLDPWDNPFQYVSPGTKTRDGYDVWSFGPDGMDGTEGFLEMLGVDRVVRHGCPLVGCLLLGGLRESGRASVLFEVSRSSTRLALRANR